VDGRGGVPAGPAALTLAPLLLVVYTLRMDDIDAYRNTIDTLADIIREIRNRVPDAAVVDEVMDEFGIEIQYDARTP
jgi:hypothetical protein